MKLKKYLKENSITAYSLSKKSKVGQSTISEFLNGKRNINFATACKLANALEMKLDDFKELAMGE